jgi:hypothetical protein
MLGVYQHVLESEKKAVISMPCPRDGSDRAHSGCEWRLKISIVYAVAHLDFKAPKLATSINAKTAFRTRFSLVPKGRIELSTLRFSVGPGASCGMVRFRKTLCSTVFFAS